jgi:hypothetical protein
MAFGGDEAQRHAVVFDCNVYLDVACALGEPFSWEKFDAATARAAKAAVPHPDDPSLDSVRAVAACASGRFAGDETVEVWTNAHIDKIVRGKAVQPSIADRNTGHRGLGWCLTSGNALVTDLIPGIAQRSNGGTLGDHYPDGNPPLDHEDGMVYGACRKLASEDPLAHVYCVTRDRGFLSARKEKRLGDHSKVITPAHFVGLTRAARSHYSVQQMRRRTSGA